MKTLFYFSNKSLDENTDFDHVYHYGTLCKIKRRIKRDNHGTIKLTVEGQKE